MTRLGNDCSGNGLNGDAAWHFSDINDISDEAFPQYRDWNPSNAFTYNYGNLIIGGDPNLDWWGYNTIREIYLFIQNVPGSPLADNIKKSKLAEARFLRAFCYFALVK